MQWTRFLIFNAIGAALWVLVWTGVGYFSGGHIDTIYNAATRYSTYLAIALGVLLLAYIARRLVRLSRARARTAT
jgi:membrane protein DedA with SNARE-associated domain